MTKKDLYLTPAQFKAETDKCLQCPAKPCMHACPVGCCPHDFIATAKEGNWQKAAAQIREKNPLAETCGLICPDKFCMKACLRAKIDKAIKIPQVQAYIMKKARQEQTAQPAQNVKDTGYKVAVIGMGPAGFGAAAELLKNGCKVVVYDKENTVGGALNLIPAARLPREVIAADWEHLAQNPLLELHLGENQEDYEALLRHGYDSVIAAVGEQECRVLGIKREELTVSYTDYLRHPEQYLTNGNVAVVGGGAAAVDCAVTAVRQGAHSVEMFVRRRICDMRITESERSELLEHEVDITTMTRIANIERIGDSLTVYTLKTRFNAEGRLEDIPQTEVARPDFSLVISALGCQRTKELNETERLVYAGDCVTGGTTAVQAVASGKNAAQKVLTLLAEKV